VRRNSILILLWGILSALRPGGGVSQELTLEEIQNWLKIDSQMARYQEAAPEILRIFQTAQDESLPLILLLDKVKEGSAKRVPPSRLLKTLEEERQRIALVHRMLEKIPLQIPDQDRKNQILKTCSIALLGGFSLEGLEQLFTLVPPYEKALALVLPLMEMNRIAPIPMNSLERFLPVITKSSITESQYGTFVSLYLRAIAGKVPPEEVLRLMSDVIASGGGILQVERELTRRIKK
jgi:hypothetical protein